MKTRLNITHTPTLEVVETLRDQSILASIEELRHRDRLTVALRASLRNGVPIESLSEASGLTCAEIRRRVDGHLSLGEDLDSLAGVI